MVRAALGWGFSGIGVAKHPQFGLLMPESCPNVPSEVLNPRNTWRDKKAYDLTARDLTQRFEANFKQFETYVDDGVVAAGIRAAARSEEHTSELQSLMRISYAVFCLKTNNTMNTIP